MERPVFQPLGTSAEQLDTPALVVDLTIMEQNIEKVHSFFQAATAKARPHVTAHKCPVLAHRQMAAGGTTGGISVSRIGEAEVFAHAGFADILVASEIVTRPKINRLCFLARRSKITVAADNPKNVHDLSEAARAGGVTLNVVVDINTGLDRCGVEPGQPAVDLAKDIARAEGLRFAGLMTYEGAILREDYQELVADNRKAVQPVLDTRESVEKAGLEVGTVSVGGTHNYEIVGAMDGVTDVRVDSYPLMDYNSSQYRSHLRPAARVLTTAVSHPVPGLAITDSGHKAIGPEMGLPVVEGVPGARMVRLSAEHGSLELEGEAQRQVDTGSKIWLIPWDLQLCVNQYDYFHAVRDGKLEAVWEVVARGRSD
jgi:D-serine deaminase-like pyridoxal phosphate-dependent protein